MSASAAGCDHRRQFGPIGFVAIAVVVLMVGCHQPVGTPPDSMRKCSEDDECVTFDATCCSLWCEEPGTSGLLTVHKDFEQRAREEFSEVCPDPFDRKDCIALACGREILAPRCVGGLCTTISMAERDRVSRGPDTWTAHDAASDQ